MSLQGIRGILMGTPIDRIKAAAAQHGVTWTDKGSVCTSLAALVNDGFVPLVSITGKASPVPGAVGASAAPVGVGTSMLGDINALKGDMDRVRDLGQANVTRLMVVEDQIKAVGAALDVTRADLWSGIKSVTDALTTLDRKADAQAVALRAQVSGIKIDDASVAIQVADAVAAAFKPFAQAVADAGAEGAVGAMVGATVIRHAPCSEIFGVEVRDMRGNEVMVDLWNHAGAPAIDPNFIWSADILRHLLLSQDTGENLWLGGEKGTGKSETARQFAARTGRAFTRINFTKHTGVEDFIGATGLVNGATAFEPKGFLMAYTCPSSVILLDEVTNADPAELAVLNGLLEPAAAVTIGGAVWRRAPGVLCFAADNTLTNGDQSGRYAGTRSMNSALADRFARIIHFQFLLEDQEVDAVVRHTGCNEVLARHVVQAVNICRSKVETGDIIDAPSIRSVCAFIRAVQRMPVADAWASAVAARQPAESAAGLAAVYAATINESLIAGNL
jgi:MoxR-like ATPase